MSDRTAEKKGGENREGEKQLFSTVTFQKWNIFYFIFLVVITRHSQIQILFIFDMICSALICVTIYIYNNYSLLHAIVHLK